MNTSMTYVWRARPCGAGRCPSDQDGSRRRGFTLVELLVVIAIIGTLVGLLLPAVQSARESARRTDCSSKMKQVMLAAINFHEARGAFPANNTGTPNVLNSNVLLKGEGPSTGTPGSKSYGWLVFVLPFMEESATHDRIDFSVAPTNSANVALRTTLIPAFACPSDPNAMYDNPIARANAAIGSTAGMDGGVCGEIGTGDTGMQSQRFRGQFCSYHGSAGDGWENNVTGFCGSTGYATYGCGAAADGPAAGVYGGFPGPTYNCPNPTLYRGFHSFRNADNIGYTNTNGSPRLPRQTAALVTDGLSSTIFLGHASTSSSYRGNGAAFYGPQCVKTTAVPIHIGNICPKSGSGYLDTNNTACSNLGTGNTMGFNSHHGPDLPVAMADGSVRWLNETIDQKTYNAMGSKNGVVSGFAAEARIVVD